MGRRRTVHKKLPAHMHRKGNSYYFVQMVEGRRSWVPLGNDLAIARLKWAELTNIGDAEVEDITFAVAVARYRRDALPAKAPKTQEEYDRALDRLLAVFGKMPLDLIIPQYVRKYLDERKEKVAGNREKAVLSTVFNHAREWGYTKAANPCAGVKGNTETGRLRYIEDQELLAVLDHACRPLRDAMEIAYYTGQRPSDVLKLKRTDIREGTLFFRQKKTGTALRFAIDGPLFDVLLRITTEPMPLPAGAVRSLYLVQNEEGQQLGYRALNYRFNKACKAAGIPDFQFRDIRGKAGTDTEDVTGLGHAQRLLGHKNRKMTEHYIKERLGYRVAPTPKRLIKQKGRA